MSDQNPSNPPASQPPASEVFELLRVQQLQISELSTRLLQVTEMLTAGKASQAMLVRQQEERAAQSPLPVVEPFGAAPAGFDAETYYVRIKPINRQRGHGRRTQFFNELGRRITGGTGQPGDVPEWVGPVSRSVAISLADYRQIPNDPYSEPVLDIVTAEEKESIDAAEQQYRAAQLGLTGVSPQQILSQMQRQGGQLNARTTGAPGPKRPRPSTVQGAQVQQTPPAAPTSSLAPVQRIAPPAAMGRAAALANLGEPPAPPAPPSAPALPSAPTPSAELAPPALAMPLPSELPPPPPPTSQVVDRGVSEDLTREARVDTSAEAAIAAAEKYVPSLGRSRMHPKRGG